MKRKTKNCNYCRAYTGQQCLLKFKIELLPDNLIVEDYTTKYIKFLNIGQVILVRHRPVEICDKPRNIKQIIICREKRGV